MRETELDLFVLYEYKQITHPVVFIQEVLKLWEQDGREPFHLYIRSTPVPKITQELLDEHLTFGEKERTNRNKILRLKTSLKHNNFRADFIFPHPDCNLLDPLVQVRKGGSSIGVSIPLSRTQEKPYQVQKLISFYSDLFRDRQVDQACIALNSTVEMDEGIYQTLFDMLNYRHKKEYIIPCRRLDWVHFFRCEELALIRKRFADLDGGFESFCTRHELYVQPLERSNGALLCMQREPEDTPEFFQQLLRNNQDFWQVMKI